MKSILKKGLVALSLVLAVSAAAVGISSKSASAETMSANCVVRPHTTLTRTSDNKVQVTFYIEPGCPTQQVSLMVYKTTAKVNPLSTQRVFSYLSTYYPAGEHTVSVNLPDDCFFQADLFKGGAIMELTDNGDYSNGMGYLLGGSKDCLTPAPVTPAAVVTTAAAPAPAPAPTVLPKTGPGDVVGIFAGVATTSGIGYNLVSRRRNR